MVRFSVALLGDFHAHVGPARPLGIRARRTQALLAYLAFPPGQPHSRDKLAALLWGDAPQHHARNHLRQTLFVLRRALAAIDPPCLHLDGESVALSESVDVDAVAFEQLVRDGTPPALEQAVALYRGDFLQGMTRQADEFEEWLMAERERLRELALEALAGLLALHRAAGALDAALQTGLRLIAARPAAGAGAPHAHASLRPARPARVGPPPVPALRALSCSASWESSRRKRPSALPGDPPPATLAQPTPLSWRLQEARRPLRPVRRQSPIVAARHAPHRARAGDGAVASGAR